MYASIPIAARKLRCNAILRVEEEVRMMGLKALLMFFLLPRTNQVDPLFSDA
jgi:hypothetical protein